MTRAIRLIRKPKPQFPTWGNPKAPILLIVDPVVGKLDAKQPLNSSVLQWLANHLKNADFQRDDVFMVSACTPVTSEQWEQGRFMGNHLKEQRPHLLAMIRKHKPKMVLGFGAKACAQVMGRSVQITKVRGQPINEPHILDGTPFLPMLSPFYAQRQPENEATFAADIATAARIAKAGFDASASAIDYKRNYRWCYDLDFLIKNPPKRLSVDVESLGLSPFKPTTKLLTVQLCWKPGESIIVPINYDFGKLRHHDFIPWERINRNRLFGQLRRLLENPAIEKVGQNLKFDWSMLWYKMGIRMENYAHDSMLLAHLLDENMRRINIDDLVRRYVPEMAGFNDKLNNDPEHQGKTRMDLLTPDKMLTYGCGDPDAALRLCDTLLKLVKKDDGLYNCYRRVTMPAQRAFCDIELNGFPTDINEMRQFEEILRMSLKIQRFKLLKAIPKEIKDKFRDTGVGLKVTRTELLRDWLYLHKKGLRLKPVVYTKTKLPSTSSKLALPFYVADHPIVADLIEYIKNTKLLGTYVKGFYKYIIDGLIRPTYTLTGTVTGRSASRDPNGQNFPKRGKLAKAYRKVFKAPPGWVYISCDLSQAELRIAAMMSGDKNMLKVYADGGDIHRNTAAGTMGITLEEFFKLPKDVQSLKRFQAKAINFGFIYGMWWVKFRQYAKTDYGIDFTEEEAKNIREMFFRTYPRLEDWHEQVQLLVQDKGMIRTYDGRIRHLPNVFSPDESTAKQAMRQAINSPVQSIASDLGLMTLGRLMPYLRKMGYDKWLKPCGFIHDAIVCLAREDMVARSCAIVKTFMQNNPLQEWFGWTPEIPIIADAEIGRTLAETYEIDEDMFMPKEVQGRSYNDILAILKQGMEAKRAKENDPKAQASLDKQIAAIVEDMSKTIIIRSRKRPTRAIITKNRGSNTHVQNLSAARPQGNRGKLQETARRSAGSVKRG